MVEALISEFFIMILSSLYYMLTPNENMEKISDPSTRSFLYNYSLALN